MNPFPGPVMVRTARSAAVIFIKLNVSGYRKPGFIWDTRKEVIGAVVRHMAVSRKGAVGACVLILSVVGV